MFSESWRIKVLKWPRCKIDDVTINDPFAYVITYGKMSRPTGHVNGDYIPGASSQAIFSSLAKIPNKRKMNVLFIQIVIFEGHHHQRLVLIILAWMLPNTSCLLGCKNGSHFLLTIYFSYPYKRGLELLQALTMFSENWWIWAGAPKTARQNELTKTWIRHQLLFTIFFYFRASRLHSAAPGDGHSKNASKISAQVSLSKTQVHCCRRWLRQRVWTGSRDFDSGWQRRMHHVQSRR